MKLLIAHNNYEIKTTNTIEQFRIYVNDKLEKGLKCVVLPGEIITCTFPDGKEFLVVQYSELTTNIRVYVDKYLIDCKKV